MATGVRAPMRAQVVSRRTLLDKPNTILQEQRQMQGEATPYLRGEADPTYLRLPGDKGVFALAMGMVAVGWGLTLYDHIRMWYGKK